LSEIIGGSAHAWTTIYIDGCPVDIKENLYRALVRLRNPTTTRLLWVDALCIDQKNKIELGDQVAKMGAIYAAAANVIVWLGEGAEFVGSAFSLIDNLSKNIKNQDTVRKILKSQDSIEALDSLTEIFRRDYWSRVWVIQEVHFARSITVQCGEYTMPWTRIVDV
jgi:hypothetical protein